MKLLTVFVVLVVAFLVYPHSAAAQERQAGPAAQLTFGELIQDKRAKTLQEFLRSHDSPITQESAYMVSEADRLDLDWRLVTAIAGVESTFGKRIPKDSFNAWGWGIPTGADAGATFDNWKEAITTVSEGLRYRYIDLGAQSVEEIGRIYAASPRWAGNVRFFMNRIEEFTPAETALLVITL